METKFRVLSFQKIILTIALLFTCSFYPSMSFAEEEGIDKATKEICNQTMLNIYYDILAVKDKYKELLNFGETAFFENKYGIYTIVYQYEGTTDDKPELKRKATPYAFAITIDRLNDITFKQKEGAFNFGFPVLGIKISGYQQKHVIRKQFNVLPLIDKYGAALSDHQQKYMPLRLYLKPLRESYHVRDDIEFEVVLKNVSKRNMIVKSLGYNSLYFLFNNEVWGTSPAGGTSGGQDSVLQPGESLSTVFKGASFQRPQEFEIYGVYKKTIEGINPYGILKVKVTE